MDHKYVVDMRPETPTHRSFVVYNYKLSRYGDEFTGDHIAFVGRRRKVGISKRAKRAYNQVGHHFNGFKELYSGESQ